MTDFACNTCEWTGEESELVKNDTWPTPLCPVCDDSDISELCPFCGDEIDTDMRICFRCREHV